jgi:hypothetical protein
MRTLFILVLGLVVGGFGYYLYQQSRNAEHPSPVAPAPAPDTNRPPETNRAKESWSDRWGDLKTDQIREELARSGKIVRTKAREVGAAVADATSDARITGAIKAKFAVDSELSALSISINTTEGVVTLSGTVSSHEHIAKAIRLALETEGVREVISTLQVRQSPQ